MEKFLERQKLPILTQKEIQNLNTDSAIKLVIETLPTKKRQDPNSLTSKFYQRVKEELTMLLKFFPPPKNRKYETLLNYSIR